MMAEEAQIERVRAIGPQTHDLPHGLHEDRPAIGRKPHDLVLVTIVRKSEKLCQRLIEDAKRMRKVDTPIDPNSRTISDAPSGTGKIAKSIDRNHDRPFKRRDMESRGQMCNMVLHGVNRSVECSAGYNLFYQPCNVDPRPPVLPPIPH